MAFRPHAKRADNARAMFELLEEALEARYGKGPWRFARLEDVANMAQRLTGCTRTAFFNYLNDGRETGMAQTYTIIEIDLEAGNG